MSIIFCLPRSHFRDEPIENITQLIAINPTAGRIFFYIIKHMSRENALTCSHKAIEQALGVHKITVSNAVKVLVNLKFVKTQRTGNSTIYFLNSDIAWKSNSKGQKYAEFTSRVVITESEQAKKQRRTRTKRINTVEVEPLHQKRQAPQGGAERGADGREIVIANIDLNERTPRPKKKGKA